jgi:hypothetical protein
MKRYQNDIKQQEVEGQSVSSTTKRFLRLRIPVFIACISIYIISQVINNVIEVTLYLLGYVSLATQSSWTYGNQYTFLALFLLGLIITIIIDAIIDGRHYGFCTGFLIDRDVLRFRLDIIFMMPIGILFGAVAAIPDSIRNTRLDTYGTDDGASIIVAVIHIVVDLLGFFPLWAIAGGTIVIAAISNKIRYKSVRDDPLDQMFADKKGRELLEEYCKHEFSTENVLAFSALMKFVTVKDIADMRKEATSIIDLYIQVDSLSEINLPKDVRQAVLNQASNIQQMSEKEIIELFHDFENEVRLNLRDTLKRLVLTTQYKKYIRYSRTYN